MQVHKQKHLLENLQTLKKGANKCQTRPTNELSTAYCWRNERKTKCTQNGVLSEVTENKKRSQSAAMNTNSFFFLFSMTPDNVPTI